jgi:tetratricopeptide (TPR) repeat protein
VQDGCFAAAMQWHEKALELYPGHISNRLGLAHALFLSGDYQTARRLFLAVLSQEPMAPQLRPLVLNNIAFMDLLIGGSELLEEAEQYSAEAIGAEPWSPPIKGTRGCVLIERGEIELGLEFVHQALEANDDRRLKALDACYIAVGESKRCDREKGREYRELARRLDPECVMLNRVDRELAACSQ